MLELYKNIRDLRIRLGLSQEDLAKKVGYKDRTSIAKIESGKVDIPQSKIIEFANALDTTPSRLMGWENLPSLHQRKKMFNFFYNYGIGVEYIPNSNSDGFDELIFYKGTQYEDAFNDLYSLYLDLKDKKDKVLIQNTLDAYFSNYGNNYTKTSDFEIKKLSDRTHTVKIYGRIPAGVPLESIEDIRGEVEIPSEWLKGNKEFIALEITGDSMYPKYLNGDTVILQMSKDCETGQDCAVYVNGNDVTFKKVIKGENYITLQPYNPQYPPQTYVGEQMKDIHILGIAKEIRRNI